MQLVCATCGRSGPALAEHWINGLEGPRCPDCNRKRNRAAAQYGTPYSIGEAEAVAKDQLDQVPDVYHRELFRWLCEEVRRLQNHVDSMNTQCRKGGCQMEI